MLLCFYPDDKWDVEISAGQPYSRMSRLICDEVWIGCRWLSVSADTT